MGLAPLLPEPRSAIPANSGEGPPLFWSPELLRRRPPTWLAWAPPSATASGPVGPVDWVHPVNVLTGQAQPLTCGPRRKKKEKKKRKMFYK